MTCRLCGRAPAEVFKIRRHVGMLVMQRFVKFEGPLCRDHALEGSKDFLKKTLVQGWWGVISFFVNFYAVFTDVVALQRAKKMPPPMAVAAPPPPPPPAPPVVPPPPSS
jgi:hypothetical protein